MLEFGELRVSPVQKADMSNQSSELGTVTTVCWEGQIKQYSKIAINFTHTRRLLRLLFRTTLKITQLEDEVWMVQKMQLCKPPCGSSLRLQPLGFLWCLSTGAYDLEIGDESSRDIMNVLTQVCFDDIPPVWSQNKICPRLLWMLYGFRVSWRAQHNWRIQNFSLFAILYPPSFTE